MILKVLKRYVSQITNKASLQTVLIISFVLQILAVVGLTGYFSFSSGKKTANKFALQLSEEVTNRIEQHVLNYLEKPYIAHQTIVGSVDSGIVNLEDLEQLQDYFFHEVQRLDHLSYLYFANKQGEFVGVQELDSKELVAHIKEASTDNKKHIYLLDSDGNKTKPIIASLDYGSRFRNWLELVKKEKKPIWSPIYRFPSSGYTTIGISLITPIATKKGELQGILASDLSLSQMSNFLRSLEITANGKALIIERNGDIVATSTRESPYIRRNSVQQRLKIADSRDPLIQATGKYLLDRYGDLKEIDNLSSFYKIDSQKQHFLQVKKIQDNRGLDWLIVIAIPKTDFSETFETNTRITILLFFAAAIVATGTSILTARWIIQPLKSFNKTARDIARGKWDKKVELERSDELGQIAQSFNQISKQLQEAERDLELRVEERTKSLIEAKENAVAVSAAKDRFMVNISEELRLPLNSILGYVKVINNNTNTTPQQVQSLRVIEQSGTYLLTLINDILDFSKLKNNRIELHYTELHLPAFLEEVAGIIDIIARQKKLVLTYETEGNLPDTIKIDEKRLRQVLINLLTNAVKFTNQGIITLRVKVIEGFNLPHSQTSKNIRFEVMDTGVGMTETQVEKIFQDFDKVGELESQIAGVGIGLTVTKQIVELMGSQLKVKTKLGTGSTFWFDLTCEVTQLVKQEEQPQYNNLEIVGYKGAKRKLLIVDNVEDNRLLLSYMLEPLGFDTIEAENGQQGLQVAVENNPDLILTDILMPVKTGLNMVRDLREMKEFRDTPIFALSASTFEVMEKESLAVGCNAFLPKPIEQSKLLHLLEKYLHLDWVYETNEV